MSSAELHENNNITVIYHNFIKKVFDEIDEVITKFNESIAVDNNSINATQDQTEKSNVCLIVATNTDDEGVLCQADIVKNKKDENEKSVTDLPSQETTINNFSDDESSPKKSKQFTFTESELPDSEEIKEFLKSYPREITEPDSMQSESESESNSGDESNWCSRRRRKKTKPVTEVPIDKLPTRFITRQRVPNINLVCKKNCLRVLQSNYLVRQESQMNEDIIRENLERLKTDNTSKGKLYVRIVKPERKYIKSKSFAYKNTKKSPTLDSIPATKSTTRSTRCLKNKIDSKNIKRSKPHNKSKKQKKNINVTIKKLERKDTKSTQLAQKNNKNSTLVSVTATKTITRRTRAMKNISDGRNAKSESVASGDTKKDKKQKAMPMKVRSTLPAVEERRSKRYRKTKDEDVMKAPVSIPKKSMHKKSTVYNISSSSSESPKNLKRSLVEDSEVPSLKRTRSQKIKVSINASTPVKVMMKTRHQDERVKYTLAQKRGRGLKRLDSNTKLLKTKTRSNSALRRRTSGTPRTSTKRLQP